MTSRSPESEPGRDASSRGADSPVIHVSRVPAEAVAIALRKHLLKI